jgi:hypothetical protein
MEKKTFISCILVMLLLGIFLPILAKKYLLIDLVSISDSMAITLGIIALFMTFFVASRQDEQLNQLQRIGAQTEETVERLETDSAIFKQVKKFFYKLQKTHRNYINAYFLLSIKILPFRQFLKVIFLRFMLYLLALEKKK